MDICPVWRPQIQRRIRGYRRRSVESVLSQGCPYSGFISLVVDIIDEVIGPCAHLLAIGLAVFVSSDMEMIALNDRIFSIQVFIDQVFDDLLVCGSRLICRDIQIAGRQHLHARDISEAFRMIRRIDLGNDIYAIFLHVFLILAIVILGIIAIFGDDHRIDFAFQTECAVS